VPLTLLRQQLNTQTGNAPRPATREAHFDEFFRRGENFAENSTNNLIGKVTEDLIGIFNEGLRRTCRWQSDDRK